MFKGGFSGPLAILTTSGLMADAVWMTAGGQGWVQCFGFKSLYVCVTLRFDVRLDFQSQCQDHGFAFLLTNNLISAKVMLFWISRASNEYLYFLFTHLTAVLTKLSLSATHLFSNCCWGLAIDFMLRRHLLPSPWVFRQRRSLCFMYLIDGVGCVCG